MIRPTRAALVLVALTLAACLSFETRGRVPFTSDQAVVGIMANDIRERGVHPVFYYGAEYAGTLEPHYLAVVFALFGATPLVFRGAMAFLLALVVLAAWAATRLAFGERAGLWAGLYLALGPSYFLYKGLCSDGAYTSLLLLSSTCLWLLIAIEARFARGVEASWLLSGLGVSLGLAWWVHSPAAFLGPVVVVATIAGTSRRWLAARSLVILALGFLAGAAPWWIRNLQTGFGSLRAAEMAPAHGGRFAGQVISLFSDGWSLLLGGQSVWSWTQTFPGARAVTLGLLVALLAFGVWRGRRGPSGLGRYAAWVSLAAVVSLSLLCLTVSRTDFTEPRYLFAAYSGVAPLVGGLIDALWPRALGRTALVAVLLTLNLGSQIRAPRLKHGDSALGFFGEMDMSEVLAGLRAQGLHSVYASYWAAYRLTFLSGNEIASSPFGSGTNGVARIDWLKARVDADPSPGFLLRDADLEAFRAFLAARGFLRQQKGLDGFVLFTDLPPKALRIVRGCGCVPTKVGLGEIVFSDARGPERVVAGGLSTHRVRIRNASPRALSDNVSLSYHWLRPDGSAAFWDGARARPPAWPPPGGEAEATIEVLANVPPGEYDLAFDLVDESVAWFEGMNGPGPRRRVTVGAATP